MIAYKFLARGAVGPFSGFAWPTGTPGPWVESTPRPCASGVHACVADDLPLWLHDELWQVELDGAERVGPKLLARRGRLLRRIDAWDAATGAAFARDCAGRARAAVRDGTGAGSAYLADLEQRAARGEAASSGFIAARIAELERGARGYDEERKAQAHWLVDRLGLEREAS